MHYEDDARGPVTFEKRHGAVPVNRPVAVTCLKRARTTPVEVKVPDPG